MNSKHLEVEFQGNKYLLIGGSVERGGPIATREQYSNFTVSFAFLNDNGDVMQRGKKIGHRDDIKVIGPAENVKYPALGDVLQALTDPASKGY